MSPGPFRPPGREKPAAGEPIPAPSAARYAEGLPVPPNQRRQLCKDIWVIRSSRGPLGYTKVETDLLRFGLSRIGGPNVHAHDHKHPRRSDQPPLAYAQPRRLEELLASRPDDRATRAHSA